MYSAKGRPNRFVRRFAVAFGFLAVLVLVTSATSQTKDIKLPELKGDKKNDKIPPVAGGKKKEIFVVPFIGLKARVRGKNFVIIADRSGSMAAGKKWWDYDKQVVRTGKFSAIDYLKQELKKTIDTIREKSGQVYVIFYDGNKNGTPAIEPQPTGGRYAETDSDFERVWRWIEGIKPKGETDPWPAFQIAFKLNPPPDVIFFMSDGIIPYRLGPKVYEVWSQLPKEKRPQIFTVQLEVPGQDPAGVLMSQNAHLKLLSPQVRGAIERAKLLHAQKLRNPFLRQRELQTKQFQYEQMRVIAKETGGKFRAAGLPTK